MLMLFFCCTLDQINAGLVSRRDFLKKKKIQILLFKNFLTGSVYHVKNIGLILVIFID